MLILQNQNKMKEPKDLTLTVSPSSPDSRWIALDESDNLISEGKTPEEASALAKKITDVFFLMFVPKQGVSYIF